jgi:hypothetical protein
MASARARRAALRPWAGVTYELVREADDVEGEGRLVLVGNRSTTSGYVKLLPLTLRNAPTPPPPLAALAPPDRWDTGDRFRIQRINGENWLLFACRNDDLLAHTTGEM